jgi:hypothetical protein
MTEYPAHTWPSVVDFFRSLAAANEQFAPMHRFVDELAHSPYAAGLYPQQSMHTLRLSQQPMISDQAERLSIDYEDGAFVVRYRGGPTAPVWTTRDANGIRALKRLFKHLRWFIEYSTSSSRPAI